MYPPTDDTICLDRSSINSRLPESIAHRHRHPRLPSCPMPHFSGLLSSLVIAIALVGCNHLKTTDESPEHTNPAHWPTSMLDAADKIDLRLENLNAADDIKNLRDELSDLVEWSPEIAADTDLDEADWEEIYGLSETLRGHLASVDVPVADYQQDFQRLSMLLREFHRKVSGAHSPEYAEQGIEAVQANEATEPATTATSEVP